MAPPRLCRIVTVPLTFATLLRQQVRCIAAAGLDLTLVSSPGEALNEVAREAGVRAHALPMAREPAPRRDLAALAALTRFLRRERFSLVHSSTPKAGLLTALAAGAAGVPFRLHTYTGQPWVERRGFVRWAAREADRLIGQLDTHLYTDSYSQRDFLVAQGLVRPDRLRVLGAGSISGVDLRRFDPAAWAGERGTIRARLGIAPEARVIVFVGRLTRDKGLPELVTAFQALSARLADVQLVLVGPLEPERDPLPLETQNAIDSNERIHAVGFSAKPERYLAAADLFCLPSYREGFGSVVIEAGAMGLPSVATRVTGLVDAVVEGETGRLVPPKDAHALAGALAELLESETLRRALGAAARQRAVQHFDAAAVNAAVVAEYRRLLAW